MTDKLTVFFDAWGMADAADRSAAVAASCAQTVSYMDPRTENPITGPEALADYVGMFSQQAPGAVAEVAKAETRGGVARATVAFKMPNGMQQMGQYFVETGEDGAITRMIGFVGTGE